MLYILYINLVDAGYNKLVECPNIDVHLQMMSAFYYDLN